MPTPTFPSRLVTVLFVLGALLPWNGASAASDRATVRGILTQSGGAGTTRVGPGVACDYASLSEAIAEAPSGGIIEVAGGQIYLGSATASSAFLVDSKSLSILGGYSTSCDGTLNGLRAELAPSQAGQRVMEVTGVGGPFFLDLVDLTFADGDGGFVGGGILIENNTSAGLINSVVQFNEAGAGGGIALLGGQGASLFLFNVTVNSNDALGGGGIYCENAPLRLGAARILGNDAVEDGGGLLADGCEVLSVPAQGMSTVFATNTADFGGAMAALGGTTVTLTAPSGEANRISGNTAREDGGGVHLDTGASLFLWGTELNNNWARRRATDPLLR